MNQGSKFSETDKDVTARILEQTVDAMDREKADLAIQMTVVTQLLLMIWAGACPQCRVRAMQLLRSQLPEIVAEAERLAALAPPPVCH